ncbi:ATP-binding protein [Haliovirga abyssi]|uniref:tRNA 2-thiocytidine(32) synthetase TtcA n=1 Tax=Haliovirga abyssi TaxID=2996794 RepID=A0AAU9DDM6_9FUSO|nr:ATP-binding protein [Haliovirga abyssi]BDU51621.1 tRNA 2-thiocytidine(32) synthetase TtcA [Haliovirga abyssi]
MRKTNKKIWKNFIKAIKEFNMIEPGDKIAVGISGGKDSLILINLFKELKKDRSLDFDFVGITLDPGYKEEDLLNVKNYIKTLDIDYKQYETNIWKVIFDERKEKNPCSLCGKMRRGILYKKAEELGCNKLALGHHFDDIIETALINMFYAGSIKTMLPKVESTSGNFEIIRPLAYVKEEEIINFINKNEIKVMASSCKLYTVREDSKRLEIKTLLKGLEKTNPNIKKSIFNSLRNVNLKYVMGYTSE